MTDNNIQENLCFSDEITFHLNELVNKHNIAGIGLSLIRKQQLKTVMNSPKLNVCCAMTNNHLIGFFFFVDEWRKLFVNARESFFLPQVRRLHKVRSIIFQQNSAPAHFARDVRQFLDKHFPDR